MRILFRCGQAKRLREHRPVAGVGASGGVRGQQPGAPAEFFRRLQIAGFIFADHQDFVRLDAPDAEPRGHMLKDVEIRFSEAVGERPEAQRRGKDFEFADGVGPVENAMRRGGRDERLDRRAWCVER